MTAISIRIPDSLYAALKDTAKREGISLNQFFNSAAGEKLTAWQTESYLQARADRAPTHDEYLAILARAPERPPLDGDERP